ncbi:hypothetical protein PCANC_00324 [Puccinia coronata f. sp. avenae]|uniref:VPS9 domain-containing protein n=1 Tax=Puccinia coronata f. sp. avenae TaxID=200324 RepID=A0A2N5W959_9BASI|nr:hypothetical protein PCANC_00324 [Puccinia coronata f. sp. avenae]
MTTEQSSALVHSLQHTPSSSNTPSRSSLIPISSATPSLDSLATALTSQSSHTFHFPAITPDSKLAPSQHPRSKTEAIQSLSIKTNHQQPTPQQQQQQQTPLPQLSQPHHQQPIHSLPNLDSSPAEPSSEDSADMTPAQKIARQVRISFSISQSPPIIPSSPTNTPNTIHHQHPEQDIKLVPSLHETLTPAQAVAQLARQMDSHSDLTPPKPCLPKSHHESQPPSANLSTASNPPSQEPVSFRVISGRKGLPGDGHDKLAVVRPSPDHPNATDKPAEPKIVKRTSKLGVSSQVSSLLSVSTDLAPSASMAFPTPPASLPTSVINQPSIAPTTTTSIPSHIPQVLPAATSAAPPLSPPVIPVAIFPTYSDEDDNGSLEYSDGGHELDSTELGVEEETDEEEDYDSNPLYIVLSTSLSPRLKSAYDSAKLVLLPTRRALPLDMPRKLPDPTLEFESEWEQWIAAHTFVSASDSLNPASGSKLAPDSSKEGIEWVGITSTKDKKVHLYLKPGTGVAEVRLTYNKVAPPIPSNNPSPPCSKLPESSGQTDFVPTRPNLEGDPHRTIRAKVGADDSDYHYQSSAFAESLTSPPPPPPPLIHNPSPGVSIERPQLNGSKTLPALTTIVRSPSTATESSLAFTQCSSGVSRASSEGWSDMPVTPPNLLTTMGPLSRSGVCKSHLPSTLKEVESTLDLPLGPPLTAPLLNPISIPSTTVTKVQTAKIISEETMYRSPSVLSKPTPQKSATSTQEASSSRAPPSDTGGLESALSGSKAKKGKEVEQRLRFKAPKWLRPGAAQKEKEKEKERREKAAAVATARLREEQDRELSLMTRTGTKLERVRLVSLKSPVIECWWQSSVVATGRDEEEEGGHSAQQLSAAHQEACDRCELDNNPPRTGGVFPFPRARTSTVTSCAEHRRMTNRSSTSLSQRSTLSSTHQSQSMGRRSSSILMPEDDRSSRRSSTRRESNKRRSRRMPSGLSVLRHSGTNKYRSVLGDFTFLLSPPEEFGAIACGILRKSVSKVWMHCHRFCETVVFLKGFESYIISQLKSEIFEPITHDIREDLKKHGHATVESWGNEDWERLTNLVENVLFAFLHSTLYSRGISCHYASEDDYLDSILHNYRKRLIPLSEFEIELPTALQDESLLTEAVEKLNQLRAYEGAYTSPSPLSPEILQRLFVAMDTADEQTVLNVLMAKTPLECISIIKQTIDILVSVWTDVSTQAGMDEEARRLTPDDLLALLASVIVRSGIQQQHSLIHYTKVFTISRSLSPETDWAFVSYQAAIAYLQSDPFSILDSQSIRSQNGSVRSMPHSPSLATAWARRRPVSFTPPTTSSNAITISARSSPSGLKLSLTDHIQPRTAPPYAPIIHTNHRHSSRANLLMRSHNPTSSLALVDPPSVRLEVTSARHDHSRSVDCLHTAIDGPQFSSRKMLLTRPTLPPISTVDRSTRRIDTAMLSAPMMDGGFVRSCSNPWDSSRSLSSIGEIVTDPAGSMGSTIKASDSSHHHHHPPSSTMLRSSLSSQGIPIRNRSFHHPFSNGIEIPAGNGGSSPPGNEKSSSPVLSRRKTVDWAGTCFVQPIGSTHEEGLGGQQEAEVGDRLELGQRSSSRASLSLLGGGGGGGGGVRPTHGRSESLTTNREFRAGTSGERDSDLLMRRTMTGSSLGLLSSSQELPSSPQPQHQRPQQQQQQQHQQQASEGWLEWGRKRLTSVTSLNMASPMPEAMRTMDRRGSTSSAGPIGPGARESFSLSSSARSSELSCSQQQHHHPRGSGGGGGGGGGGGAMTPAMEALSRARAASSLSLQRPPSSSSGSLHPRESSSISDLAASIPDRPSAGMIPLRPIRPISTSLLSRSVGPHLVLSSDSNSFYPSSSAAPAPSSASATPSSATLLDWNRSTSSLHTLH